MNKKNLSHSNKFLTQCNEKSQSLLWFFTPVAQLVNLTDRLNLALLIWFHINHMTA